MAETPTSLIDRWLAARAAPAASWLAERCAALAAGAGERELALAFALVGRRVAHGDLALTAEERRGLAAVAPGWDPGRWSLDQLARLRLLLALPATPDPVPRIEVLFVGSSVAEQVALYQGLALFPAPERFRARAAEGLRSNMKAVFEAVALRNPYPAAQLDEGAWNQMVLKALFVGSPLHPIVGLEARANERLSAMLCDYAHERWAAGRSISPELWRPVGQCPAGSALDDLRRVATQGTAMERRAAALALRARAAGLALLADMPDLAATTADLRWSDLVSHL